MRNALLLSGSLGLGHDVVAEACAASLGADGWSTQTLDAMRLLGRRVQQPAILDRDVLAAIAHLGACKQLAVDGEELARHLVALVVRQEDAVAFVLDGISAGHHVDQQPAFGDAVERGRHARRHCRRLQAGPHRDQKP